MTPEQFTYWLQGFVEIQNPTKLDRQQTQIIKDHLKEVFEKKTPNYGTLTTSKNTGPTWITPNTTMPLDNQPTFIC
jgi:hypothetical protein